MISPAVKAMIGELAASGLSGVRMMSPDGTIGEIPQDQVENAIAAGFKVMTNSEMAQLYNRQEIERRFFEKKFAAKYKPVRRVAPRGRR
jgi:hypothetical protein